MKIDKNKGYDVDDDILSLGSEGAQVSDYAFNRRWFNIIWLIISSVIFLLITKVFYISIINHNKYASKASGNILHTSPIIAPRGRIFSNDKKILVDNIPNYSATILYEYVEDDCKSFVDEISKILKLNRDDIINKINIARENRGNIVLKEKLTHDDVVLLKSSKSIPKYIQVEKNALRIYNDSTLFSHIMGYEGLIQREEYENRKDYLLTDRIGKTGLEYQYENLLHGTHGYKKTLRDSRGKIIKQLEEEKVIPGDDLYTHLNFKLQKHLTYAIKEQFEKAGTSKAVGIALDPRNGAVLALVSLPSYDNNLFSNGISVENYGQLLKNPDKPLFNRAISGAYPPGSTVKPPLAAVALEEGIISPEAKIESRGGLQYGKFFFGDWKAHGFTDMRRAIAVSSDVYFYVVGGGYKDIKGLGIEKMHEGYEKFGYGNLTGIDLPNEISGINPDKKWKLENIGERWYIGDTFHSSIGQGFMTATPLQIATSIVPIANGGTMYKPKIIKKSISKNGKEKIFEPEILKENVLSEYSLQVAKEGMRETVTEGTARMLKDLPIKIAGKTGTSEFGKKEKVHSWFVSFAPYDNPEILLLIMMEGQVKSVSTSTVPIAKSVYEWYFKQEELDNLINLENNLTHRDKKE